MSIIIRRDSNIQEIGTLERDIPTGFNPGEPVSISVRFTPNTKLQDIQLKDSLPPGLELVSGDTSVSADSLPSGGTLAFEYKVQAAAPGTFPINC